MRDRGLYPISLYPGQTRLVQLLNLDESVFTIPAGATAIGRAIDVLQQKIADLAVTISDGAKGLVRIELPNTQLVRDCWQVRTLYDVQITSGALTKFLPLSELDILYSPSQQDPSTTANPYYTPNPGGVPTGGNPATTPAQSPTRLYIQDQIWVDNTGKKVVVTIERQANGAEYFKLTEVLP